MTTTSGRRARWARRWPVGLAWALTLAGLGGAFWFDHLLSQAGSAEADRPDAAAYPVILAAVSAATVGAVMADLGVNGYERYGVVVRPGSLPGAPYLAGISFGIFLVWVSLAGFVLLLTPTGSLPSPGWRWWARVAAAGPALELLSSAIDPQPRYPEHPEVGNPLAFSALRPVQVAVGIAGGAIILASLVVAAVSLVLPEPGRPGRAAHRAAGRGRPDHAADAGLAVAAAARTVKHGWPAHSRSVDRQWNATGATGRTPVLWLA